MKKTKIENFFKVVLCLYISMASSITVARDLDEIQDQGVLRHIGTPYGNFVKSTQENNSVTWNGLDVELMQGFAAHLGVKYQFVELPWDHLVGGLTGKDIKFSNQNIILGSPRKIQGDLISNGMTTLEWRKQFVDFSDNYFCSAVWLFARSDSTMQPIIPSGSLAKDIVQIKLQLKDRTVLTVKQTSLDAKLYNLQSTGANIIFKDKFYKLIPALLGNEAESTLLDVADGLVVLDKWAGEIKVVGPISEVQYMAVGFSKESPKLRLAFNAYLKQIRADGAYEKLVTKYYPNVFHFYPDYFSAVKS